MIVGTVAVLVGIPAAWLGVRTLRYGSWYAFGLGQRPVRHSYTHERYTQTQEIAGGIVAALEGHRGRYSVYPSVLGELVPDFLPAIERPRVGDGLWQYEATPERFKLRFIVGPIYQDDSYDSSEGSWYVDR